MADDTKQKMLAGGVAAMLARWFSATNDDGTAATAPAVRTTAADGSSPALGATTDAEATGNGSLIAITKRLRTLLGSVIALLSPSATLYDGSQATSTTAAPLNGGTSQAVSELVVTNTDASIKMFVGNATSQSTPIAAGASVTVPVDNLNKVYVKAASGTPTVAWLGRS